MANLTTKNMSQFRPLWPFPVWKNILTGSESLENVDFRFGNQTLSQFFTSIAAFVPFYEYSLLAFAPEHKEEVSALARALRVF